MGLHAPGGPLSLDTLAASLSESLLPSALLAHASASDGKTSNSSKSSSSGSTAPGEVVGGVSIEQCPPAPQLQSHWAPAADPILAYGTGHPASSALQLQQQQQKSDSKGRAHRQRQQQQEEDVPRQYATSTAFFAGVSPIATEAGLLSVFEQFGTVIRVNLFRPYKTSKTSKASVSVCVPMAAVQLRSGRRHGVARAREAGCRRLCALHVRGAAVGRCCKACYPLAPIDYCLTRV